MGTKLDLTEIVKNLKSYTAIKVSLRSQTPWAQNDQIISQTFYTPMGKPSAPRHLKVYKQPVTFQPFVNETLANQYFILHIYYANDNKISHVTSLYLNFSVRYS